MEKKISKKLAIFITTILIFSLFLGVVAFADDNFKTLKAWFGNISIYRNNQQVQLSAKPFIIDGTTYVPLRAMSELFNKEVGWDGENYRIDLNDRPDESLIYIAQQLVEEQAKVRKLEAKIAELEAGKKDDIKDLESYLNRQHGTYEKVSFDIDLYKDKDNIDVDIYVDLDYDYREWDGLSTSNIKSYFQDIVDDILCDYKNADIKGSIMDSSTSRKSTLISFYTKSNGTVVIDKDYRDDRDYRYDDLGDLEGDLNRYYGKYEGIYFDIWLYEDSYGDIEVTIIVDEDEWNDLGWRKQEKYLEDIYKDIIQKFSRVDVYGYVYDYYYDYKIDSFDFDSDGYVDI